MNFKENYKLQDKVLSVLSGEIPDFYLTGGTALSRFYLHHRFSEDLDFFADNIENYAGEVLKIRRLLLKVANVSDDKLLQYESFSRIWIDNGTELKIEVVNDTGKRWGNPIEYDGIFID
ncbi:MAG: nucleotidyl transferase AbiEii/AbiGii toxin family protein, partial [Balneolales bacterium]